MSDPDMLFAAWAQPIQEDTADNLLSALRFPMLLGSPPGDRNRRLNGILTGSAPGGYWGYGTHLGFGVP